MGEVWSGEGVSGTRNTILVVWFEVYASALGEQAIQIFINVAFYDSRWLIIQFSFLGGKRRDIRRAVRSLINDTCFILIISDVGYDLERAT